LNEPAVTLARPLKVLTLEIKIPNEHLGFRKAFYACIEMTPCHIGPDRVWIARKELAKRAGGVLGRRLVSFGLRFLVKIAHPE